MGRIITVKGTGRASAPADQVILNMELKTLHRDYTQCMSIADSKCALLQATLAKDGFSADDIKTADFKIRQDYHYGKNSAKIMDDWECHHSLKVEFPLDIPRLQQILMNIASSGVQLEFSVDFTLSDGNALQEEMLSDAAANARKKAEILCAASGVKLGDLLEINYSWGELSIISDTEYHGDFDYMALPAKNCYPGPAFTPEDIDIKDTATFVWAIE